MRPSTPGGGLIERRAAPERSRRDRTRCNSHERDRPSSVPVSHANNAPLRRATAAIRKHVESRPASDGQDLPARGHLKRFPRSPRGSAEQLLRPSGFEPGRLYGDLPSQRPRCTFNQLPEAFGRSASADVGVSSGVFHDPVQEIPALHRDDAQAVFLGHYLGFVVLLTA